MGIRANNNIKFRMYTGRHDNNLIDINDVVKLNNLELNETNGNKGFMLYPYSSDTLSLDVLKRFLGRDGKLITQRDKDGELQGFILYDVLNNTTKQQNEELAELSNYIDVNKDKAIFIQKVLVAEKYRRQGMAEKLLNMAIQENPDAKYVVSSIIVEPENNVASIKFHEKNGFEHLYRIGIDPPIYPDDIPYLTKKLPPLQKVVETVMLKKL